MEPVIVASHISKKYIIGELRRETSLCEAMAGRFRHLMKRNKKPANHIWALRDIEFSANQGEVVGIIGRNGAGKSTLLKVLSRITEPTTGHMDVQGRVASLLEVGTGFHQELTGRENIYLNGSILGMRRHEIRAVFDQIVSFAGVEKFIDTPIKRYSSGMRLRLGFAVAAHLVPDVLLVDEVLAVGDAEFQKKCLDAMDNLHSSGRTVLFVSHNMAAIENLCSRVIWIDQGRIRQDGPANEVIQSYFSTFSSPQEGGADLRHAENRRGNGDVLFTAIELLDADGGPGSMIRTGDPVRIRLHYEVHRPVLRPHFGVKIKTEMGTLVADVNTWSAGYELHPLQPGTGWVDVKIDCLNLIPARYYLSLWLQSVGSITYDYLDRCTVLDIESSDFYNSGRGLDRQFGIICLPSRWSADGQNLFANRTEVVAAGDCSAEQS